MQYRRGEDGGENAIESQAEAGEGTIAIADTEGATSLRHEQQSPLKDLVP